MSTRILKYFNPPIQLPRYMYKDTGIEQVAVCEANESNKHMYKKQDNQ